MEKKYSVYDIMDFELDPYKVLKIDPRSNNQTIKDAYNSLLKGHISKEHKDNIEKSYNIIKNEKSRIKYNILRNKPYNSLDEIKELGIKPIKLETNEWINYLL